MKLIVLKKISATEVNTCLKENDFPNIESFEANVDDSGSDIYLSLKEAKDLRDTLDRLISDVEMIK